MTQRERLEALAEAWGVLTEYADLHGQPCPASDEALIAVTRALGAPVASLADVDAALADRRRQLRSPEPVLVAWQGVPTRVDVGAARWAHVHFEGGGHVELLPVGGRLQLPTDLPPGLHTLIADDLDTTLIVAPLQAWSPPDDAPGFGVFLPHHALHDANSRGLGDVTTLGRLGAWAADEGARLVGTLPMLPTFLGGDRSPYEPSPYSPVSRRFFGEHLVDPTRTPEWPHCEPARRRLADAHDQLTQLRRGEVVDPAGAWTLQRALLADLTQAALAEPARRRALVEWTGQDPDRALYAWFRAHTERAGAWPTWPEHDRDVAAVAASPAVLHPPDDDPAWVWRYAQWCISTQLQALRDRLDEADVELYLDLPIGVHPDGFDTWRAHDSVFVDGASVGAPPDPYFPSGQDWGFPPARPEQAPAPGQPARQAFDEGPFGQLWQALEAHTAVAHRLRLDHVMGLYRLYWVPRGLGATDGVYVRYDADVGWALITLASHRHRCAIVGENLGMVPDEITAALERHAVRGMAVAQFALRADPASPLAPTPPGCVASLNTHDTPTFAGWWAAEDLDTQRELGWLDDERDAHERHWRSRIAEAAAPFAERGALSDADVPLPQAVAAGLYRALAESDAHLVLVNLEDLWGESRPHNVPGTWRERPNWLRRSALSLEEAAQRRDVAAVLADLREVRPR